MQNIFCFDFIGTLDSTGILNTLKKVITSAMECADGAAFTLVMSAILRKFIAPEATVINVFTTLRVVLLGLGN